MHWQMYFAGKKLDELIFLGFMTVMKNYASSGGGGGVGILNKDLYGKVPPQGPIPYPFIYHFY